MKDLIIDCFAGGGGASVGIEMALGRPVDIAINHDPDCKIRSLVYVKDECKKLIDQIEKGVMPVGS